MVETPHHIVNHEITNNGNGRLGNHEQRTVDDLTISVPQKGTLIGIDGIDPEAPNSPHNVVGNGTGIIKISGFSKASGETIKLRLKNEGGAPSTINKNNSHWTFGGNIVISALEYTAPTLAFLDIPSSEENTEFAMRIDDLNFKIDNIFSWIRRRESII